MVPNGTRTFEVKTNIYKWKFIGMLSACVSVEGKDETFTLYMYSLSNLGLPYAAMLSRFVHSYE